MNIFNIPRVKNYQILAFLYFFSGEKFQKNAVTHFFYNLAKAYVAVCKRFKNTIAYSELALDRIVDSSWLIKISSRGFLNLNYYPIFPVSS